MVPWWSVWNPADMYSSALPKKFQSDLQSNISHKTTIYVHCVSGRHTRRNPNAHLPFNLFLGALYSPHQLHWNRQKSDLTGWKWSLPRAFPRDQARLFPTKCYIQWVLKCKGSRGSLGKLIHFSIIYLHLKFSVSPLTEVGRLREEHR